MIKQVIVARKDLNMRKGKLAAQVAHASMAVLLKNKIKEENVNSLMSPVTTTTYCTFLFNDNIMEWLSGPFTKIVVGCDSEEAFHDLYNAAEEAGLPNAVIRDSGKTEFDGVPTYTCLAIGPAKAEEIDKITGGLKLL